ncbi:MAG TPA: DUF4294 domain-containing protein [Paludibacteraceae bacterium]|jgi:hypothetical protein|nr:DUF4294 domain-containing protein [Paludibacteraceae bacterium]OPZ01321.1 MAG: hypothetical protein BWZ11_01739 [Bacteroidetes bacterium ADurb.BinA395]HOF99069.1 DUF4294 domain-containing protein [Paludibacteraceae bacterium]HOR39535.1 DUF4294 domain-containing protein [Paludibacteraceae bacterium]HPD58437.1 DUF4294 domain-containing protein [Paludibacteraceae bacterium]
MKRRILILFTVLFTVFGQSLFAQMDEPIPPGGARLMVEIKGNDTIFLAYLHDLWVFPKMNFKNKKEEQYYWKMVRDVKRTLPYAKLVAQELSETNKKLMMMPNDKERKKFLAQYEKDIYQKYEPELKKLTLSQGKLLIKLIDRECNNTSYDLIKLYRGSFRAFFYQGFARLFGANLKSEFDYNEKDKILDRIIVLVEAGQL